eukprot:5832480-Amphidinium_carterae.1
MAPPPMHIPQHEIVTAVAFSQSPDQQPLPLALSHSMGKTNSSSNPLGDSRESQAFASQCRDAPHHIPSGRTPHPANGQRSKLKTDLKNIEQPQLVSEVCPERGSKAIVPSSANNAHQENRWVVLQNTCGLCSQSNAARLKLQLTACKVKPLLRRENDFQCWVGTARNTSKSSELHMTKKTLSA